MKFIKPKIFGGQVAGMGCSLEGKERKTALNRLERHRVKADLKNKAKAEKIEIEDIDEERRMELNALIDSDENYFNLENR